MKKWISNAFLLGMLFVFATIIPERQTNAAEEYTYYLTINQVYQYEITKEQFESIRGSWDSLTAEGVLEIARQIVPPEQIPSRVTNIGIRAVPKNSAEGTLPVYPFDSEEDSAADNDFVISQGILLRYKGSGDHPGKCYIDLSGRLYAEYGSKKSDNSKNGKKYRKCFFLSMPEFEDYRLRRKGGFCRFLYDVSMQCPCKYGGTERV